MKRFISAITSLAIAATAMGGTFALSSSAAVDKTIIDFTTVDKTGKRVNEIEANPGDKIPLTIYVPQSSGVNNISLKLAVNGDATLGQGTVQYPELDYEVKVIKNGVESYVKGQYYETEEGKKHINDAGKVAKNENLWGNYGITLTDAKFADPYCFDSGLLEGDGWGDTNYAGKATNGNATFKGDAWNLMWMYDKGVTHTPKMNADAYGAWVASGSPEYLTDDDMNVTYDAVTTWDTSTDWAYKYAFATATINLPSDLPDGKYEINFYDQPYYNSNSIFDTDYQRDSSGAIITPQTLIYKPTQTQGSISGANGAVNYEIKPLKIIVGEGGGDDTTTTSKSTSESTTTTTISSSSSSSSSSQTVPTDTILYQFVKQGEAYNSTIAVEPGANVPLSLIVSNDPGTAGASLYLDFDSRLSFGRSSKGTAYSGSFQWSPDDKGLVWTCTDGHNQTAADGASIYNFTVKIPADAANGDTFKVALNENNLPEGKSNSVRPEEPVTEKPDHKFVLQGVTLTVGEPGTTVSSSSDTTKTTSSSSSVQNPTDAIAYQFVKNGSAYAPEIAVQAGDSVALNLTVSNDPGTAGASLYFDFDSRLSFGRSSKGTAYSGSFQWSPDDKGLVWTCTDGHNQTAADGSTIYSFTVKVPADAQPGDTFKIALNENNLPEGKSNSVRPEEPVTEKPDHKFVVNGVTLKVAIETTTSSITTSSETTTTTTSSSTSDTETTTTPKQEAVWGDVDCNGTVSIADVVLLNKYLAGNAQPSAQGLINADVTHDNTPDAQDSVKIKAYLALLIEQSELAVAGAYTAQ